MAELTFEQHMLLGGSYSTEPYFGGFVPSLGGIWIPGKAEQVGGNHYAALTNKDRSIAARLDGVSAVRVCKDSGDAEDEFSVAGGVVEVNGDYVTVAAQNALGPLATGNNRIWLEYQTAAGGSLVVAFGAAWPTRFHVPLASIAMPASGHWLATHLTREDRRVSLNTRERGGFAVDFTFATPGTFSLAGLPLGVTVMAHVLVRTAFNGSTPTLALVDIFDSPIYATTADHDLESAGLSTPKRAVYDNTSALMSGILTLSGASAGAGTVLVDWWRKRV